MGNLLGPDMLHKIPEYRYGKPKTSMRKIKNIMRERRIRFGQKC